MIALRSVCCIPNGSKMRSRANCSSGLSDDEDACIEVRSAVSSSVQNLACLEDADRAARRVRPVEPGEDAVDVRSDRICGPDTPVS